MNTQPVGFIGVGQMGLPMARNLLSAGFELVVFDVNPKALAAVQAAGARTVDSPVQVAAEADVVLVSLPAPPRQQCSIVFAEHCTFFTAYHR